MMQICSFPLNYRYATSPLSDSIARRIRHQVVRQTRRLVLQPINSAFRRTRTRTERGARKRQLRLPRPLLLAFMLVLLDTILVRNRGNPGASAGRRHAHAVFFLAILGAWCAFPKAILSAAGLQHGTLAPPGCIQNLRYKNQAILFRAFPRILSRVNSRHAKAGRDWTNARMSARVELLARGYVFLGYSIFGKHSRSNKIGRDLRVWFIASDPSLCVNFTESVKKNIWLCVWFISLCLI